MFTKNSQIGFGHIYQSVALGTSTSLWLWALLPVYCFGHFYQSVALGTSTSLSLMLCSQASQDDSFSSWRFLTVISWPILPHHTPPLLPTHPPSKKYTHHPPTTKEHRPINQHNKQTASPVKLPVLIGICSLAVGS